MPTMSALPRLLNCISSEVLLKAHNSSAFASAATLSTRPIASRRAARQSSRWRSIRLAQRVKVAYDVAARTGRIIGEGGARGYGALAPYEIAGSIDVLGVVGDTVVVIDWKTGAALVDPASRNWQLHGYALAACRALGKERAHHAGVHEPGQPNRFARARLVRSGPGFAERLEADGRSDRALRSLGCAPERSSKPARDRGVGIARASMFARVRTR